MQLSRPESCPVFGKEKGKIEVDLYRKDTDRNQYLLPSSCHNKSVTKSIPFSLSLRIVRTCTIPINREKRFSDLKERLLHRGYSITLVESALERARQIPRERGFKEGN